MDSQGVLVMTGVGGIGIGWVHCWCHERVILFWVLGQLCLPKGTGGWMRLVCGRDRLLLNLYRVGVMDISQKLGGVDKQQESGACIEAVACRCVKIITLGNVVLDVDLQEEWNRPLDLGGVVGGQGHGNFFSQC